MKKLLFALPIIGLLLSTSCDKDESDEIIDDTLTLDESQIEIVENPDNKDFNLIITPGLYGPTNVDALTNVTYSYYLTPSQSNNIPFGFKRHKIYFYVDDPQLGWIYVAEFDIPSNRVTVKFPAYQSSGTTKWQITYEIYRAFSNISYKKNKIVTVNN